MGIAVAIAELLGLGPAQWGLERPAAPVSSPDDHGCGGLDAAALDDVCCQLLLPALDDLAGQAVASGAVGLWLHGHSSRHGVGALRLIVLGQDRGAAWAALASHARRAGWTLQVGSGVDAHLMGPSAATPVHLLQPMLPDEAFDGPRGYQRGTLADWALAVEALAMAATATDAGVAQAALSRLRFLLELVPDVLWTHALRRLSAPARAAWLGGPHAASVPELRELAEATPWEGMAS